MPKIETDNEVGIGAVTDYDFDKASDWQADPTGRPNHIQHIESGDVVSVDADTASRLAGRVTKSETDAAARAETAKAAAAKAETAAKVADLARAEADEASAAAKSAAADAKPLLKTETPPKAQKPDAPPKTETPSGSKVGPVVPAG